MSFSTSAIYSFMAVSDDLPLSEDQASYLALATKSYMLGASPPASPSVACLYSEYSASSVSLSGALRSVLDAAAAASKSASSDAAPGAASLDADFDAAAAASKTLRKAPDNDTLLALYSLYKQASVGDVSGDRPGALDMVNRAKFDAWSSRKGTSREDAMRAYIELVKKLKTEEGA